MQSRGQFGARHFDKVFFNLPIPVFEAANREHVKIANLAKKAEKKAGEVILPENVKFQRARGLIRDALVEDGIAGEIDVAVRTLLD
jgi:hypothetical protein